MFLAHYHHRMHKQIFMKEKKKENTNKDAAHSVKTPPPPQVMDPSKPPAIKNKKGDIKKDERNADPDKLAPKDEL
jgi:hypothetical protein